MKTKYRIRDIVRIKFRTNIFYNLEIDNEVFDWTSEYFRNSLQVMLESFVIKRKD